MIQKSFYEWLIPIAFFQLYLAAVALLFFFGPWPWIVDDAGSLAAYLTAASFAIGIGYALSWPQVRDTPDLGWDERARTGLTWLRWATIISLLMTVPTSLARTGQIFPDVVSGFVDTGKVYNSQLTRLSEGTPYVVFEYVRFILSPFLISLLPLTVVYWKRANIFIRCGAVSSILFYLGIYVARGQNKGFADIFAVLPFFILQAIHYRSFRINKKWVIAAVGVFVLALVGLMTFFCRTQQERSGAPASLAAYQFGSILLRPDPSYWISGSLPEPMRLTFESLARYLGQGYQATALTLHMPHKSTLGVGNSMFLARNADRLLHTDFFTNASLPALLEKKTGWSMYHLWHSIYPWIASDVGYGGALLVVGIFGYLLGLSWGKALKTSDMFWLAMLYMMLILFFYIPGNNQIFQSGETTVAFFILLCGIILRGVLRIFSRRCTVQPLRTSHQTQL